MKNNIVTILAISSVLLVIFNILLSFYTTNTTRFLKNIYKTDSDFQSLLGIIFHDMRYKNNKVIIFYQIFESDYYIKIITNKFRSQYFITSISDINNQIYAMNYSALNIGVRKQFYTQYKNIKKGELTNFPDNIKKSILESIDKSYRRFRKNRSFFHQ